MLLVDEREGSPEGLEHGSKFGFRWFRRLNLVVLCCFQTFWEFLSRCWVIKMTSNYYCCLSVIFYERLQQEADALRDSQRTTKQRHRSVLAGAGLGTRRMPRPPSALRYEVQFRPGHSEVSSCGSKWHTSICKPYAKAF